MDEEVAFKQFKALCDAEGLLQEDFTDKGDDVASGIQDDGTLLRFLRARDFNVENALKQYRATREWRATNGLIDLYESIDVSNYEETRKLYTHWTGRRDRRGAPVCWFEIQQLTPSVMAAYKKSCNSAPTAKASQTSQTESEPMRRLFCTYENLTRFVLPLCSAVPSRSDPESPITDTTCIVDISGVSLMQLLRLRSHMQAASALATAHYPETLGRTYIIGAPYFFPTVWGWINGWFAANTVAKIRIVPSGKELSTLSETIDPINIPEKYGGQFPFEFGMAPDLDHEIKDNLRWLDHSNESVSQELPMGPLRWVERRHGEKTVVAVGTVNGVQRNTEIMALC